MGGAGQRQLADKGPSCLMWLALLRSVIPQVEAPLAPTRLSPDILATAVGVCVCVCEEVRRTLLVSWRYAV